MTTDFHTAIATGAAADAATFNNPLGELDAAIVALTTGWIPAPSTWTYASPTTFTVSGDVTARFRPGVKLRLVQSAVTKYYYVISSVYSSPNTTVTVIGASLYPLVSAAITSPYYSNAASPQYFPHWFDWAPTLTGWSANPTNAIYRYVFVGTKCTVALRQGTAGTSNATSITITLPTTAATITNMSWYGAGQGVDSGSALAGSIMGYIASGGTVLTIFKDWAGGVWTASGNKQVAGLTITYEVA